METRLERMLQEIEEYQEFLDMMQNYELEQNDGL